MRIGVLGAAASTPSVIYVNTDPYTYDPALNTVQPGVGINPDLVHSVPSDPNADMGSSCPPGYALDPSGTAVCLPAGSLSVQTQYGKQVTQTSFIPGLPDMYLYLAAGGLLLMGLLGGRK